MAKIITILALILLLELFSTYAADKGENVGRLINAEKFNFDKVETRKRKRNDSESSKCEGCLKNATKNEIYFAHDEANYMSICEECFENRKKPKKNDRILIQRWYSDYKFEDENSVINLLLESSKDEKDLPKDLTVAEIIKEKEDGSYEIKILDGKNVGKNVSVGAKDFTKLAHEIMPNAELCDMCGFFKFNEKACSRYNCDKIICSQCYEKFPTCAYCKLLRKGNAIKVRAIEEIFEKLSQTFGSKNIFELYGIVEELEFDTEDLNKVFYKVKLALDYNWPRDQQNRIIPGGKLMLVEPTHTVTLSEKHVTIFKADEPEGFEIQGVASLMQSIHHMFHQQLPFHQRSNVNNHSVFLIPSHDTSYFRFLMDTDDREDDISNFFGNIPESNFQYGNIPESPTNYFNVPTTYQMEQHFQLHSTQQQQSQQNSFNMFHDTSNDGEDDISNFFGNIPESDFQYGNILESPTHYFNVPSTYQMNTQAQNFQLHSNQQQQSQQNSSNMLIDTSNEEQQVSDNAFENESLNIESELHPDILEGFLEHTNNNLETLQELQESDDSETMVDLIEYVDHDTESNSDHHSETYSSTNN